VLELRSCISGFRFWAGGLGVWFEDAGFGRGDRYVLEDAGFGRGALELCFAAYELCLRPRASGGVHRSLA
jgi:hypothetical protein